MSNPLYRVRAVCPVCNSTLAYVFGSKDCLRNLEAKDSFRHEMIDHAGVWDTKSPMSHPSEWRMPSDRFKWKGHDRCPRDIEATAEKLEAAFVRAVAAGKKRIYLPDDLKNENVSIAMLRSSDNIGSEGVTQISPSH